jgi:hypothetical protein
VAVCEEAKNYADLSPQDPYDQARFLRTWRSRPFEDQRAEQFQPTDETKPH